MFAILVVRDVVESLPHVSVVGSIELCFNFSFVLAFCGFDGFADSWLAYNHPHYWN